MNTPPVKPSRKPIKRRARSRFSPEYGLLLNRLVAARKAAGVTQKQIAEQLGKEQAHVSKCEHRETEISIIDLWKWCHAIGIPVSEFMRQFEEDVKQLRRRERNE
jgi:transcriptional regulator with XRE-family HTH domain